MIEYMSFKPIRKTADNLLGFISFKWNNEFQFTDIGVYALRAPKATMRIRLRYPERARPKGSIYSEIEQEINSYIVANYNEVFK